MRGSEILNAIEQRQSSGQEFIRWWRRENDFADYELIDDFRKRVDSSQEFEGFELLDIEAMWRDLVRLSAHRLVREKRRRGDLVIWEREGESGEVNIETHPFSPQTLISIFDVETRGDTLV